MIGPISRRLFLSMAGRAGLILPASAASAAAFGALPLGPGLGVVTEKAGLPAAVRLDNALNEIAAIFDPYLPGPASRWRGFIRGREGGGTPYLCIERFDTVSANDRRLPRLMIEERFTLHHPEMDVFLGNQAG